MSFELFNTHADICTKMAAATKSHEVRDQWNKLAAQWRSKANACKPNVTPASESTKFLSPTTAPEPPVLQAKGAEALVSKATLANVRSPPSVVPSDVPHDEQSALDEIWQALQAKKPATIVSPEQ